MLIDNSDLARTALLVIDLQKGFVTADSDVAVAPAVGLVDRWVTARDKGLDVGPVVLTRYRNHPGSPYERLLGWHAFRGPPETDLVDELTPFVDQVHLLDKTGYTAFTPEGLDFLSRHRITDVVVCGIATDACVLKTVLDAFDLGFTPWVVQDAVASFSATVPARQLHDSAITLMGRLVGVGRLTNSTSVLSMLVDAVDLSKPTDTGRACDRRLA